jgi:hypothetical protein
MDIQINKPLFTSYVGLTASGYELADLSCKDVLHIINKIKLMEFKEDIIDFFSLARTEQSKVNPYWPRGSSISSASIFIADDLSFKTFENYIEFERITDASNEWSNDDFVLWIKRLPAILRQIQNHPLFEALWNEYKQIMSLKLPEFKLSLDKISCVMKKFNLDSENTDIIFVPNMLQAAQIADYVIKDKTFYVIMTHVNFMGLIHEVLHPIIHKFHNLISKYAVPEYFSHIIDINAASSYSYQFDNSIEAKSHFIEECLVRGISASMAEGIEIFDIDGYCEWHMENGFLLVPSVIETTKKLSPSEKNLSEFIEEVMNHHISAFL